MAQTAPIRQPTNANARNDAYVKRACHQLGPYRHGPWRTVASRVVAGGGMSSTAPIPSPLPGPRTGPISLSASAIWAARPAPRLSPCGRARPGATHLLSRIAHGPRSFAHWTCAQSLSCEPCLLCAVIHNFFPANKNQLGLGCDHTTDARDIPSSKSKTKRVVTQPQKKSDSRLSCNAADCNVRQVLGRPHPANALCHRWFRIRVRVPHRKITAFVNASWPKRARSH